METFKINYNESRSILCDIGNKYDVYKSTQRAHTLFYDGIFRKNRNTKLNIAKLGILNGGSLLMWKEYFINSQIYGFECNEGRSDKQNVNNDRISILNIDITNKDNITKSFSELNVLFDIIIDDTTQHFEDQVKIIENIYQYLKPGGVLIIEDIPKSHSGNDYINRLSSILKNFQIYYFVEFDHIEKTLNNNKLLVLIKRGSDMFKNVSKLTIITPSYRVNNLSKIKNSINFKYVDKWIIVYDGSKVIKNPHLFRNYKIKEYVYKGDGISGNPQRNYALTKITNQKTLLYYLDDDNIVHPNLYKLLDIIDDTKIYSFNQSNGLKGNNIQASFIDTAMVIIPYNLCKNIKWIYNEYGADFYYIKECCDKNETVYVDNELCYYNKI